ncbi:helix-turn-helix domain-containing protein [Haloarchaeobius sp. DT45]|uniref:helix-turn-helix domain-containing protein n=1 Tax=Haloarchaeobius sp. DT45 TaxID=3446116 RepID=UPI003F6C1223
MGTQGSEGTAEDGTGVRVTLDIWHPECWTLQVTEATAGGLLGHGVHTIEGQATGRFTAYGETTETVDELVAAIDANDLTESVWETDAHGSYPDLVDGNASRGIVVEYDIENSINDSLVKRGFIPDEPVRMFDGREYWTVLVNETRTTVHERIEEVRAEMDADVRVELITAPSSGTGIFQTDDLSERQREVYELARTQGYYSWPREVNAGELAAELDVSKATLLEHLRKAEAKLLGE